MEIPITTLQAMLTNAATLGAMSAVKRLDPVKDELKASEVRTWLGNDSKMSRKFDAMVRKGMIKKEPARTHLFIIPSVRLKQRLLP